MRIRVRSVGITSMGIAALAMFAIAAGTGRANAAEPNYAGAYTQLASMSDINRQFEEMQVELASLRTRLNNGSVASTGWDAGGCDTGGCDTGGCDSGCDSNSGCESCSWDWWTSPDCGITASLEVVWLRPQYTSPGTPWGNKFDHGSRMTLGYLTDTGREFRIRYFELGATDRGDFLNVMTLDLEYAARFELGWNWAGDISLGARYASYSESIGGDRLVLPSTIGPVIGLHLKSDVWFRDINGFANLRYSHQFGNGNDDGGRGLSSYSITELQMGLEWTRSTCGGNLFARGFFEAQKYAIDGDNSDEDVGLVGFGLAAGFTR